MNSLNEKLALLQTKMKKGEPITIMIMGLGSVGLYLFDYLVSLGDPALRLVVTGRNRTRMESDVNIVRTAAAIRRCLRSQVEIEGNCDLDDVSKSIHRILLSIVAGFIPD